MPVIKSAIKKLRQDRKREKKNDALRASLKLAISQAKKTKSGKSVAQAVAVVDKASKNKIIHSNKAARLKSTLTKLAKPTAVKTQKKAPGKTAAKKTTTSKASPKKASK